MNPNQKDNSAVQTQQTGGVPAFFKDVKKDDLGTDGIGQSDIVIPRLKICQALSTIKEKNSSIKDGDFYNHVEGVSYGNKLNFFTLLMWSSRVKFSIDRKLRGLIFRDIITHDEIRFGADIEKCITEPDFTEKKLNWQDVYNYMIIPEENLAAAIKNKNLPFPIIYSSSSASRKYTKQLNGKFQTNSARNIPIYGQLVQAHTFLESFQSTKAYMPQFDYGRYNTNEEFVFLKEMFSHCRDLQRRKDVQETSFDIPDEDLKDGSSQKKKKQDIPF